MPRHRASLACLATVLALAGCSPSTRQRPEPPTDVARSALARDTTPDVDAAAAEALRVGATDFALELHRSAGEGENAITSAHSVQVAFGMLRHGALGETAAELDAALGWDALPPGALGPAMNALDLALASRAREGVRLDIIDQAWAQTGYPFEAAYLDALAVHHGAGIALWDFASDPDGGRVLINSWVAGITDGNIDELIPDEDIITELTRLVLVNAVHFDAAWEVAFDPAHTTDETFTRPDASTVMVPTMHVTTSAALAEGEGWSALELPYAGGELALLVIEPQGSLSDLEASLDTAGLDAIVSSLRPSEVRVAMPRFSIGTDLDLIPPMQALGAERVFTPDAELEGIGTEGDLYVTAALHSATIEVSELGTEASAATAVVVGDRSASVPPAFVLDHPFFFAVRDRQTGALLFVGRVTDPS